MSVQATFAATLVDEWVQGGVTDAVVCPGSRSTPLTVALAQAMRVHIRLDERSAAFFALGLAMANGNPTIVCTTSGTAAAELHPAVVEAHHARVPLIVCTADRPPELQHVGASQTIDQIGLYTTSTRWACAPGVPEQAQQATWRPLAARALAEATNGPLGPGPVHLNLAFRDPLVGSAGPLPSGRGPTSHGSASDPKTEPFDPPLGGRGLIIAGARASSRPSRLLELGEHLGWPVLADPRSGARMEGTIAAADAIMRADPPLAETILVLGAPWLSKALTEYISSARTQGARIIVSDPWWQWTDPTRVVTEFHHVDPDALISAALNQPADRSDPDWRAAWLNMEGVAQAAIDQVLSDELTEPMVARMLTRHAAAVDATIFTSASMPMRDLEWYAPAVPVPPPVLANRGANGIDGVVSTAVGLASAGRRTYALLGDLAFLHDVSGLVNLPDVPCTFVVVDNGGGGIFSFLPQADAIAADQFEMLFGTPPTSDISEVARGFGLHVHDVSTVSEFDTALAASASASASALIRVRVPDRSHNVVHHNSINQAVRLALA